MSSTMSSKINSDDVISELKAKLEFACTMLRIPVENLTVLFNDAKADKINVKREKLQKSATKKLSDATENKLIIATYNVSGCLWKGEHHGDSTESYTLWNLLHSNSVSVCALQEVNGNLDALQSNSSEHLNALIKSLNDYEEELLGTGAVCAYWKCSTVHAGKGHLNGKHMREHMSFIYDDRFVTLEKFNSFKLPLGHSRKFVTGKFKVRATNQILTVTNLHAVSSKNGGRKTLWLKQFDEKFSSDNFPHQDFIVGDFNYEIKALKSHSNTVKNFYTNMHGEKTHFSKTTASSYDLVLHSKNSAWSADECRVLTREECSVHGRDPSDHRMVVCNISFKTAVSVEPLDPSNLQTPIAHWHPETPTATGALHTGPLKGNGGQHLQAVNNVVRNLGSSFKSVNAFGATDRTFSCQRLSAFVTYLLEKGHFKTNIAVWAGYTKGGNSSTHVKTMKDSTSAKFMEPKWQSLTGQRDLQSDLNNFLNSL